MKRSRLWGVAALGLTAMFVLTALVAMAGTKYATGVTSAAVTFAPAQGPLVIKSVYAASDKAGGVIKFYARAGTGKIVVTNGAAAGATNAYFLNTSFGITNADTVVYVYANGNAPEFRTVNSSATNVCGISAALTYAQTNGDYVYEVTQQGQILVGLAGAAYGTSHVVNTSGDVFVSPGDSPVYVVVDATSNAVLQATSD